MTAAGAMDGDRGNGRGALEALTSRLGSWAAWLLPFAVVALLLGWETDWGRRIAERQIPESTPTPPPVQVTLLPEFGIPGGANARRETVDRTLFNPTRRPAPLPPQEGAKARMQRGQFVLTGTAVTGSTTIAFLKEAAGGKARTARPGDVVNGMTVAEVRPDRVKFTLGDESEDVVLKVAAGPKTTIQPVVAPPAAPAQPAAAPGQPGTAPASAPAQPGAAPAPASDRARPGAPAGTPAAGQPEQAQTLLERRRAARAAAAAASAAGQVPQPGALPPAVTPPAAGMTSTQ